jgi:hypothetical protein
MQRGEILRELERLRNMVSHKQHLEEIKLINPRKNVNKNAQSHDNNVVA